MVRGLVGAKVQTFPVDKLLPKTAFQPNKDSDTIRHVLLYITPKKKKKKLGSAFSIYSDNLNV